MSRRAPEWTLAASERPRRARQLAPAFALVALAGAVVLPVRAATVSSEFVAPFVARHCAECHGEKKQKADLRLDTLSLDLADPKVAIRWQDVVDALKSGEMPPDTQPRPPDADIARLVAALDEGLRLAADQSRAPARFAIRRLSRSALDHTVHDLLGLALPLSRDLPDDPAVAGFENMAQTLATTPELLAKLQANARTIAAEALVEGPDPRANRSFGLEQLDHGMRVHREGSELRLWSSKNRLNVVWPRGLVVPRLGWYRVRLTALARDNRHDFPGGAAALAAQPKNRGMTAPPLAAGAERFVAIRALPADEVRGVGGEATGGREVGRVRLGDTMATAEIECLLEPGENIFLHYISAPRLQNAPLLALDGREVLLGETMSLRDLGVDGPLLASWPPPEQARLLGSADGPAADAELETRLRDFVTRAFRRPVEAAALARYTALFRQGVAAGHSRVGAMRLVVETVLCSPHFLFNRDGPDGPDAWSLASRLSYFLWNSMPDDMLLALAATGELLQPATVEAQVRRLLADPKSARFVGDFTAQWLGLKRVGAMLPDPKLFPSYDKTLEVSMRRETEEFFAEILRENLPVRTFLEADFAMLNARLARHYGIPGVAGDALRRVELPPGSPRGGLLAQASMLTITSNGSRTSPVVRGVWVLENLLDSPPSPPPPNIEPLEPDVRGATTIREMLAKHRKVETCNDCHRRIDPYGFALENFDAIGAWRTGYADARPAAGKGAPAVAPERPIDASGQLPDGTKFAGFFEMRRALAEKSDRFARALAGKLLGHALGHQPTLAERRAVDRIVADNAAHGGRFADLIVALCRDEAFLNRAAPRAENSKQP